MTSGSLAIPTSPGCLAAIPPPTSAERATISDRRPAAKHDTARTTAQVAIRTLVLTLARITLASIDPSTILLSGSRLSHPFERVFVVALAIVDFADEQVALRIDGETVSMEKLTRVVACVAPYVRHNLHRLPVENPNGFVGAVHH